MKIKNILCIIMASAMIFALQTVGASQPLEEIAISAQEIGAAVDQIADEVREDLEVAINNAAQAIADATIIKNQAIVAGIEKTKTSQEVKNIVDAQDVLIMQIKQDLMKLAEDGMATVDNVAQQASYMSQFATGAQQFGAWLWNPATENERELARQIIAMLEEAKKTETNPAIIQQLNQQINDQKLITGDKMSTRQMLLIGAVGTAAAIAGITVGSALLNKVEGLKSEPELDKLIAQQELFGAEAAIKQAEAEEAQQLQQFVNKSKQENLTSVVPVEETKKESKWSMASLRQSFLPSAMLSEEEKDDLKKKQANNQQVLKALPGKIVQKVKDRNKELNKQAEEWLKEAAAE